MHPCVLSLCSRQERLAPNRRLQAGWFISLEIQGFIHRQQCRFTEEINRFILHGIKSITQLGRGGIRQQAALMLWLSVQHASAQPGRILWG